MKSLIHAFVLLQLGISICLAPICFAQEAQTTENQKARLAGFDWLRQFEGTWATGNRGIMKSRAFGNHWIVNELSGQAGQNYTAIQSISYDAEKKQFTGSWIDSTSSYEWHYSGSLDSAGKILTLEAEGPDFTNTKKTRRYLDIYEFKSENEIAAVSKMMNDQGEWKTFQTATMTRQTEPEIQTNVTPFLMFTGQAGEAINFYETVFPDTKVKSVTKYKAGENGKQGTVKTATIEIAGQRIMFTDSPVKHDFEFTPSFSFFVECENEDQLKKRFAKLSDSGKVMMPLDDYGLSQQFGWVSDKFGVSWQLNLR